MQPEVAATDVESLERAGYAAPQQALDQQTLQSHQGNHNPVPADGQPACYQEQCQAGNESQHAQRHGFERFHRPLVSGRPGNVQVTDAVRCNTGCVYNDRVKYTTRSVSRNPNASWTFWLASFSSSASDASSR